jgi:hypothetical protein
MNRKEEGMMAKKIAVLCILCCFTSGTLYAQAFPAELQAMAVQDAGRDILEKLDALIAQLDRGSILRPDDIVAIISEIQSLNVELQALADELGSVQPADRDSVCAQIQWISMAWLGIGASSLMSLLGSVASLIIRESTPDTESSVFDTISLVRQYLRLARKTLVTAVIVPVALINMLMVSRQYRDCMNADF